MQEIQTIPSIIRDKIIEATKKEANVLYNQIDAAQKCVVHNICICREREKEIKQTFVKIEKETEQINEQIKQYIQYMDICKQLDKKNEKQYDDWAITVKGLETQTYVNQAKRNTTN